MKEATQAHPAQSPTAGPHWSVILPSMVFSSIWFINQENDGSSTTELWGWSQQGLAQEEPQGEIPLQSMIWALQNGLYSDRSSAQCSSAHTSQLLQCKTPFLPLIFLILNSLRKELGSLTHMPSVRDLTCMLQTGGVPGLVLTEKWVLPLWSCFEFEKKHVLDITKHSYTVSSSGFGSQEHYSFPPSRGSLLHRWTGQLFIQILFILLVLNYAY